MSKQLKYYIILLISLVGYAMAFSQDDIYEDLLKEEVQVENPVYMPVIGIGPGVIKYIGEVKSKSNFLMGSSAVKINISTFVDSKHFYKANFFIMMLGSFYGNQYSISNIQHNFNFNSPFTTFGISTQYSFEHFIKSEKFVHPFLSLGFELTQFSSRIDLKDNNSSLYAYYPDGTIRNASGDIITRDYNYDTDLRQELDFGAGSYTKSTIGIPLELGLNFKISERAYVQLSSSIHYTFTDLIDHVSSKNTKGYIGTKGNDMFAFTNITFHYDFFSEDKTITMNKLFADIDFDYTLFGDEDNDMVFDRADNCPGTPEGVAVDSLGCPFDNDLDGVPDYKDMDKKTRPNAMVNESGVELKLEDIIKMMSKEAVGRQDVKSILRNNLNKKFIASLSNAKIPEKFKSMDKDNDGYISYEEVLDAVDKYFDSDNPNFNPKDIYELKDFFFTQ